VNYHFNLNNVSFCACVIVSTCLFAQFLFPLNLLSNPGRPIKPICLPRGEVTPLDLNCYAAGWGASKLISLWCQ